ncbi:predicted protein, partial [Nematostella vectensis]
CNSCELNEIASSYCFECKCLVCVNCIEIHDHMKSMKSHRIIGLKETHPDDLIEIVQGLNNCMRSTHENEVIIYYCTDCHECICEKCMMGSHLNHKVSKLEEARSNCKIEVSKGFQKLEEKTRSVLDSVQVTENSYNNAVKKIVEARKRVREHVSGLVRVLRDHERDMVSELDRVQIDLRNSILSEKKSQETHLKQLLRATESIHDVMARELDIELLDLQRDITKRMEELLNIPAPNPIDLRVYIDYNGNEEIIDFLKKSDFGRLDVGFTDPRCSEVKNENLNEALTGAGERMFFDVLTKDSEGNPSYSENDNINVRIKSDQNITLTAKISNNKDGTYKVNYTPLKTGTYTINVTVRGEEIRGSPFKVFVATRAEYLQASMLSIRLESSFGEYQTMVPLGFLETGQVPLRRPCGVAVSKRDVIAVADSWNSQIRVINSEGGILRILGNSSDQAMMVHPVDVAFDDKDNILVTDSEKHRVLVLRPSGECIKTFGSRHLKSPLGILVDSCGNVVICDYGARSVKLFTSHGNYKCEFKSPEVNAHGKPPRPCYIAERNSKYLVSYDNDTIQVFDPSGDYLYSVGGTGHGEGRFREPRGLHVDARDRLFVCDSGNHRVQVMAPDGSVRMFGTQGGGEGEFDRPQGVTVMENGDILVTDKMNNRVHTWKMADAWS